MITTDYSGIKKYFIYLVTAALLIISGCKTNPPNAPVVVPVEFGKVFITANVPDAEIWVDNMFTGQFTPDTIEAKTGDREISLIKDDYLTSTQNIEILKDSVIELTFNLEFSIQRVVLIEDFANVSCIPCVNSNKIIESLTNVTYGSHKLVAIKYPTNFPSPNDPFYLANSEACNLRMAYYNIFFAPTTIINGTERPISTDSISIKEAIDQQLAQAPKFSIDMKDSVAGSNYITTVTIKVLDGSGLDFSNLVLHTVLTETDIEFANPPGSNGETKFYDVMRVMMPGNAGESLEGISQNEEVIFQYQTEIDPVWIISKLHTVTFIQDVLTKEVFQAGSTID